MSNTTEQKGFLFFATTKAMMGVNWTNAHASIDDKFFRRVIGSVTNIAGNLYFFTTGEKAVPPVSTLDIPVSGFAGERVVFASSEGEVVIAQSYDSDKLPVHFLTELLELVRPNSFTQESPDFDAGKTIISSMDEDSQIAMNDGEPAELPKLADFIIAFLAATLRPQQGYSASLKDTTWYTELRNTERFPAVKKILLEVSASYYISYYPNTRVVVSFDRDFVFNKDKTGKSFKAFEAYLENYIPESMVARKQPKAKLHSVEEIAEVAEVDSKMAESLGGWSAPEWLSGDKETVLKYIDEVRKAINEDFVKHPIQVSIRALNAIGDMEDWYFNKPLFRFGYNRLERANWFQKCDVVNEQELVALKDELLAHFEKEVSKVITVFEDYNKALADGYTGAPLSTFCPSFNPSEMLGLQPIQKKESKMELPLPFLNIDWESEPFPAWFNDEPEDVVKQIESVITAWSMDDISVDNPDASLETPLLLMISMQSWAEGRWCVSHPLVTEIIAKMEQCKWRGMYSSKLLSDFKQRLTGRLHVMLNKLANDMTIYHKAKNFMDVENLTPAEVIELFRNSPDYGKMLNEERPVIAPAHTSLTSAHGAMEQFKEKVHAKSESKKASEKETRLETIRNWANIPQQIREMAIMDKLDAQSETLLQSVVESMATDLGSLLKLLRSRR